ncbi:L-2-hydroxyglutarate oxidase LhgO [Clostridium tepidiprofundi DSM 19306]|uniref:L-2-hydroxyglutarate oxidase LhgO n=1 Tax=Clostridium tepidiprofundi DSM 19306 TaxID=1121338 RepID=A0A151B4W3_9CLOT|nr:NAD(P)/FAD-dependent oxidoreductase [Clostridium tepidiprofundi]KYH34840.1 L-2-hydroxyglutarate oxidase LhgO [Clostridium tepidiprofundi DSM 19306]
MYDITIIGTGVIGCNIARELSRYNLNICVLERNSDIAEGTTKANSAIIHAGHDAEPGTLKGKLNARGNSMFDKLSKELDFPFKRNGSLVLCFDENEKDKLLELKERGEKNGVPGLEILEKEQVLKREPYLSEKVVAALYAPTGGIVCPYEMTIALAENAYTNGVEFYFNTFVNDIEKKNDYFIVKTKNKYIETKIVINAAGLYADKINNMVSENKINIIPRRGEYCLFDKSVGNMAKCTLFQLPTELGKGVLVTPTVDGNLLIGPNRIEIGDKEDVATTQEGISEILNKAKLTLKEIPMRQLITSFAGLRAHSSEDDFIIGEAEDAKNFINVAGIESPGLSSAPAIAEMVVNIVKDKLNPELNKKFNPIRKGIPKFREMSNEERKELINQDASYGRIICRCETVTEGEIINAIKRPLGARTLDGVKRRTRAGMGRCQSGFCSTKIADILSRELNISRMDIVKNEQESKILIGKNKTL